MKLHLCRWWREANRDRTARPLDQLYHPPVCVFRPSYRCAVHGRDQVTHARNAASFWGRYNFGKHAWISGAGFDAHTKPGSFEHDFVRLVVGCLRGCCSFFFLSCGFGSEGILSFHNTRARFCRPLLSLSLRLTLGLESLWLFFNFSIISFTDLSNFHHICCCLIHSIWTNL